MAIESEISVGDVVQCDPEHCRWGAIFVVVTEVKPWGVQGYFLVPGEEGLAYVRVTHAHYKRIGTAEWITAETGD